MPQSSRSTLDPQANRLLQAIRRLHATIRDAVVRACETTPLDRLSQVAQDEEGDTIYQVDRVSEALVVDFFRQEVAPWAPLLLIGEGLPNGGRVLLPQGVAEEEVRWRVIVDPIDGTRELMYQKRPAWILTGVAANHGPETGLHHIELAVQTEIPLVKQHLSDVLWAVRGQGAWAERVNRLTGQRAPLTLRPSQARSIAHGFAMLVRYFPGARDELAAMDEEMVLGALGPVRPGKAHCFEDQYLSSAGQLYELMAGHYRFVGDLRPLMEQLLARRGLSLGICAHPYDLCTELIARELGVIVTDERGRPLQAPLSIHPNVTWVGYANPHIRAQMEPQLRRALARRGLLVDDVG